MPDTDLNLSEEAIARIAGFLGYGNVSARVWFVGIEEGLGKVEDLEAATNLAARGTFEETMDLRQAHLRLTRHGRQIDMEMEAPPTQVWRWMARIMLATEKKDWRKDEFVEKYVRTRLGRERGILS